MYLWSHSLLTNLGLAYNCSIVNHSMQMYSYLARYTPISGEHVAWRCEGPRQICTESKDRYQHTTHCYVYACIYTRVISRPSSGGHRAGPAIMEPFLSCWSASSVEIVGVYPESCIRSWTLCMHDPTINVTYNAKYDTMILLIIMINK